MSDARELHEWLRCANVGDYRTSNLPGNLAEIHVVPGGWIYVFKDQMITSGGNELQLTTQFVPEHRTKSANHHLYF